MAASVRNPARIVGRLTPIWVARSRSAGRRSPGLERAALDELAHVGHDLPRAAPGPMDGRRRTRAQLPARRSGSEACGHDGRRIPTGAAQRDPRPRWPEYRLGVDRTPASARYLNQGRTAGAKQEVLPLDRATCQDIADNRLISHAVYSPARSGGPQPRSLPAASVIGLTTWPRRSPGPAVSPPMRADGTGPHHCRAFYRAIRGP